MSYENVELWWKVLHNPEKKIETFFGFGASFEQAPIMFSKKFLSNLNFGNCDICKSDHPVSLSGVCCAGYDMRIYI